METQQSITWHSTKEGDGQGPEPSTMHLYSTCLNRVVSAPNGVEFAYRDLRESAVAPARAF